MLETTEYSPETNGPVSIDRATVDDAMGIVEIRRQCWLETYPNEAEGFTYEDVRRRVEGEHGEGIDQTIQRWRYGISSEDGINRQTLVARANGKIIGFASPLKERGKYHLGALYVLPEAQHKGVGRNLLRAAIDWYGRDKDIYLQVVSYNTNAIAFYEKHGFRKSGKPVNSSVRPFPNGKSFPEIEMVLKAC